jgi:hypothetical protein
MTEEIKHSPEPWRAGRMDTESYSACDEEPYKGIYNGPRERNVVPNEVARGVGPDCRANAHRIVACVNACAGLSAEALEAGKLDEALATLKMSFLMGKFGAHSAPCVEELLRALGRLP